MNWKSSLHIGFNKGLKTTWNLIKIIVPVSIFVSVLNETPIMDWLTVLFQPAMGIFGLPAEAAIVLVLGFVSGLYAAIGAIVSLSLTTQEILIIAVMLSFAHNMVVESAVTTRLGVPLKLVLGLRLGLAAFFGILLNVVF